MKSIEQLPHGIYVNLDVTPQGCWLYTGRLSGGYGRTTWNGRSSYVHRIVYEIMNGPIPAGLVVDHLCRNRACCRPLHLEAVTNAENIRRGWVLNVRPDMLALRTSRKTSSGGGGSHPLKEECYRGHVYQPHWPKGPDNDRICITCYNIRNGFAEDRPYKSRSNGTCRAGLHEWKPDNLEPGSRPGRLRCAPCRRESKNRGNAASRARRKAKTATDHQSGGGCDSAKNLPAAGLASNL